MDNGLVHLTIDMNKKALKRLNPYCSGQWSRTKSGATMCFFTCVLILIVVDNGLVLDLIRLY